MKHGHACKGAVEPHVIHDAKTSRYHAQLRCHCGAINRISPKRWERYADAEALAYRMPVVPRASTTPRRPPKQATIKRENRPELSGDNSARQYAAPVAPETINAGWLGPTGAR